MLLCTCPPYVALTTSYIRVLHFCGQVPFLYVIIVNFIFEIAAKNFTRAFVTRIQLHTYTSTLIHTYIHTYSHPLKK